jgi:hypothetical protein
VKGDERNTMNTKKWRKRRIMHMMNYKEDLEVEIRRIIKIVMTRRLIKHNED